MATQHKSFALDDVLERAVMRNLERGASRGSPSDCELRDLREAVTNLRDTAAVNNRAVEQMVTLLNDFRSAPDFNKRLDAWFREFAFSADKGAAALARVGGAS